MARYVVENGLNDPADLQHFNVDGYRYFAAESRPDKPLFRRPEKSNLFLWPFTALNLLNAHLQM